ncbi:MAG: glycosyltransferase [Deltaproteobacteria bacterium]|nr:MAG: glycosyltransferase [Deltaproteobacteria bacterium]
MSEETSISVVLPVYNEEDNIEPLTEQIVRALSPFDNPVEIVFIDDGSTDRSVERMEAMRERFGEIEIRIVQLDRNYGLSTAMTAGFEAAKGEVIVTLDADLQNDPADIPKLLEKLPEYDAALGWRVDRRDPFVKRVSSKIANFFRKKALNDPIHDTGCSLKAYKAQYVKRIKMFKGMHRFLGVLLAMEGAMITEVPVSHHPRRFGKSKYGFWNRLISPFLDLLAVRWMKKRAIRYHAKEIT